MGCRYILPVAAPRPVLNFQIKGSKLNGPPMLCGSEFSRSKVAQRVIISVHNAFVPQ